MSVPQAINIVEEELMRISAVFDLVGSEHYLETFCGADASLST
jgi:hypothetical protein